MAEGSQSSSRPPQPGISCECSTTRQKQSNTHADIFIVANLRLESVWLLVVRQTSLPTELSGKISKQVAQRATIAHLSPMCQGQISFKKTYKWAKETRGLKSNSSELLCLSWLPATLMMIRSKMNELAWRHHFPIISLWKIF